MVGTVVGRGCHGEKPPVEMLEPLESAVLGGIGVRVQVKSNRTQHASDIPTRLPTTRNHIYVYIHYIYIYML